MFSGWKMDICVPEVVAVGHRCTYKGHYPEDRKVEKIIDWPDCNTLTEVQGFLGICGVIRIWVKDFARHAKSLVLLTKDTECDVLLYANSAKGRRLTQSSCW